MNLIIFLVIATAFLIIVEIAKRRTSLPSYTTRKISHIGAALIAAVSPWFLDKNLIVLVCLGFAGVMIFSRRLNIFSSIHEVNRNTLGEVFLPLGEALSAAIFLPQAIIAFQYGVLVMGLSDAFAGFVGEKIGKHDVKIFKVKKTFEGSLVFFLTTIALTFAFSPGSGINLILVPLILTLVELFLGYGTDNLALPVIGAFLFTFLV